VQWPEGERRDRVRIATVSGVVEMPWSSRFELLKRVRRLYGDAEVIRRFEVVGATRPVTLDPDSKLLVFNLLEHWLIQAGVDGLPEGIFELRNALHDDLDRGEFDSVASGRVMPRAARSQRPIPS
jgi:hypothetical protein